MMPPISHVANDPLDQPIYSRRCRLLWKGAEVEICGEVVPKAHLLAAFVPYLLIVLHHNTSKSLES